MLLESHHIATDSISSFDFFQSSSLLRYAICRVRLELDHSGACVGWSTVEAFSKQHVYQQESSSQFPSFSCKRFCSSSHNHCQKSRTTCWNHRTAEFFSSRPAGMIETSSSQTWKRHKTPVHYGSAKSS